MFCKHWFIICVLNENNDFYQQHKLQIIIHAQGSARGQILQDAMVQWIKILIYPVVVNLCEITRNKTDSGNVMSVQISQAYYTK